MPRLNRALAAAFLFFPACLPVASDPAIDQDSSTGTGTGRAPGAGSKSCKLTYKSDDAAKRHLIYCGADLLAVYSHEGNTFIEFWWGGKNVLGGFSSGTPGSNSGGAKRGHSSDYPYGRIDGQGNKPRWEGFWAGYGYMDKRWKYWEGVAGNPFAEQSFDITLPSDALLDMHVKTIVGPRGNALFSCDVHYYISVDGIGVRSEVTILREIQPLGFDDTGGQIMMTQVDCDLDPAKPNDTSQPDLYFKLGFDKYTPDIDPFPPYNKITPSNIYADQKVPSPSENRVRPLPNTALVASDRPISYLTPFGRPGSDINLALRVDLKRSTLPPLEYYCEYNGERDYLNYLYSTAIGSNRSMAAVAGGTKWILYGDLRPWKGSDPQVLYDMPIVSGR